MQRTLFLCAMAAMALSGCNPPPPATPVDLTLTKEARDMKGFAVTPVRTYVTKEGARSEVSGVPCTLSGSGFSGAFQSPAAVNVPVYGLRSRAIQTTCTYQGKAQTQTSAPFNVTEQKAVASGSGGGLLGALVVAAAVSGREDRESDEYGYAPIILTFND